MKSLLIIFPFLVSTELCFGMTKRSLLGPFFLELNNNQRLYSAEIEIHKDGSYTYKEVNPSGVGINCRGTYSFKDNNFYGELECPLSFSPRKLRQVIFFEDTTDYLLRRGAIVDIWSDLYTFSPNRQASFIIYKTDLIRYR